MSIGKRFLKILPAAFIGAGPLVSVVAVALALPGEGWAERRTLAGNLAAVTLFLFWLGMALRRRGTASVEGSESETLPACPERPPAVAFTEDILALARATERWGDATPARAVAPELVAVTNERG